MILFWGSSYPGIRAGLTDYSPGSLALLRYTVASLCMLFIYYKKFRIRKIALTDALQAALLGVFGFAIYNVALNYGEITVSAGTASFIIAQVPVLLTVLAIVFRGDRLTARGWLGVTLCILGIGLISFGEEKDFHFDFGLLCVFISMLAGCVYSYYQKMLLSRLHPIEFTAYAIWGGTAAMLIYLPKLIVELPQASLHSTLSVIYIGIFPAAIAYLLWGYLSSVMNTSKAASFLYLVPPATVIIAWFWLREIPTEIVIFGGMIALLGAFLANRGAKSAEQPLTSNVS